MSGTSARKQPARKNRSRHARRRASGLARAGLQQLLNAAYEVLAKGAIGLVAAVFENSGLRRWAMGRWRCTPAFTPPLRVRHRASCRRCRWRSARNCVNRGIADTLARLSRAGCPTSIATMWRGPWSRIWRRSEVLCALPIWSGIKRFRHTVCVQCSWPQSFQHVVADAEITLRWVAHRSSRPYPCNRSSRLR